MSITVELHIFSGNPNPQWEISEEDWKDIEPGKDSLLPPLGDGLGYQGFSVQDEKTFSCSVGTGVALGSGQSEELARELQTKLLATAPENVVSPKLRGYIKGYLDAFALLRAAAPCVSVAPPHGDDAKWNAEDMVKKKQLLQLRLQYPKRHLRTAGQGPWYCTFPRLHQRSGCAGWRASGRPATHTRLPRR